KASYRHSETALSLVCSAESWAIYSKRWKEETIPTREEWKTKLMDYAEMANLTGKLRNQEVKNLKKKEWDKFIIYLGAHCKQMKTLIDPSPPVPQTTQGFIGWRSTVPGLGLERYSKIISTKGAFYKDVQWPNEPTD
uniref:Uncharacterized protein n=1 Tax=Podarcis muralis TaxID=64176 RepID=A0A670I0D7_PODMU